MGESFAVSVDVRFRDLDPMGHVNNAAYATYLEEARRAYYADVVDRPLDDVPTVLATLEIDYRSPITLDDEVRVEMAVPEIGESSIPMEYEIYAADALAATAETVQVVIDPETERSTPIPDEWRQRIDTRSD